MVIKGYWWFPVVINNYQPKSSHYYISVGYSCQKKYAQVASPNRLVTSWLPQKISLCNLISMPTPNVLKRHMEFLSYLEQDSLTGQTLIRGLACETKRAMTVHLLQGDLITGSAHVKSSRGCGIRTPPACGEFHNVTYRRNSNSCILAAIYIPAVTLMCNTFTWLSKDNFVPF